MTAAAWCLLVLALVTIIVSVYSQGAAYRNGFSDGVRWMEEGDSYPSKPVRRWSGWHESRRIRDRLCLNPKPKPKPQIGREPWEEDPEGWKA